MITTAQRLCALPILAFTLACSGLLPNYGDELGSAAYRSGQPFEVDVKGTGKPVDIWAKSMLKTHGGQYVITGSITTTVGAARPESKQFTLDQNGLHEGKHTPSAPRRGSGPRGNNYSVLKLASLPEVPEGETLRLRGTLTVQGTTLLTAGTIVVTE